MVGVGGRMVEGDSGGGGSGGSDAIFGLSVSTPVVIEGRGGGVGRVKVGRFVGRTAGGERGSFVGVGVVERRSLRFVGRRNGGRMDCRRRRVSCFSSFLLVRES